VANPDAATELTRLREDVASGSVPSDEVPNAFERLTYLLTDVHPEHDQALRDFTNDLERVRFGKLPENQVSEMSRILDDAQLLFDAQS
jgi:hypothetical protein